MLAQQRPAGVPDGASHDELERWSNELVAFLTSDGIPASFRGWARKHADLLDAYMASAEDFESDLSADESDLDLDVDEDEEEQDEAPAGAPRAHSALPKQKSPRATTARRRAANTQEPRMVVLRVPEQLARLGMGIAGGAVLIFMGFHLAGVINLGFLSREHVYSGKVRQRSGFLRSFSLGLIFAAGWTPCIGPVLGAIIGLASFDGESARGTLLLVAYSLGLGVPFIAAAMAVDSVTRPLKQARLLRVGVPIVSGVLVVGIGVLMLTNTLVQMPQYFDWGGSPRG